MLQTVVNLVNTIGPHGNNKIHVFDEIPSIGPLVISIQSEKRPNKVSLEPGGKKLDYQYSNGKILLTLPELEIHDIIVVK